MGEPTPLLDGIVDRMPVMLIPDDYPPAHASALFRIAPRGALFIAEE